MIVGTRVLALVCARTPTGPYFMGEQDLCPIGCAPLRLSTHG